MTRDKVVGERRRTFACHDCPYTSHDPEATFQHMMGNDCPGRSIVNGHARQVAHLHGGIREMTEGPSAEGQR